MPLSPQASLQSLLRFHSRPQFSRLCQGYRCYCFPGSGFSGLFGSLHLEQVAQFHPRLVQLGLAVSDRASHDRGDLIMLVTFNVVKYKDRPVAGRETFHGPLQLQRAVESLPPGYRTIFVLHDVEGYEHNEIATIVGCSIGNSKSQLHKARMKLRDLLKM